MRGERDREMGKVPGMWVRTLNPSAKQSQLFNYKTGEKVIAGAQSLPLLYNLYLKDWRKNIKQILHRFGNIQYKNLYIFYRMLSALV